MSTTRESVGTVIMNVHIGMRALKHTFNQSTHSGLPDFPKNDR